MTTWVPIFDDSFQRVPVRNYGAMYADGYRVMAGYVAGGTSGKWVTAAEIKAWLSQGRDTGFLPLFEAVGDEPVRSPNSGTAHARVARAGARARGVPDTSAISPAMDRDVSKAQAEPGGPIATYMRLWKAVDTTRPLPYIEMDAGGELFAAGLTVGTGTPAAYEWDSSHHLITPDNAPAHVLWTQERNGQNLHGGNVDIGHIRTTAPIYWANPNHNTPEEDMTTVDLTPAAVAAVAAAVAAATLGTPLPNGATPPDSVLFALNEAFASSRFNATNPMVIQIKALQAQLSALKTQVAAIPTTAGAATISAQDKADIAKLVLDGFAARQQS